MDSRKKDIKSVQTGGCAESYPCQHSLTITYKDGTKEGGWAWGPDIVKKYYNYLGENDKEHFSQYRNHSRFFSRWANSEKALEIAEEKAHNKI